MKCESAGLVGFLDKSYKIQRVPATRDTICPGWQQPNDRCSRRSSTRCHWCRSVLQTLSHGFLGPNRCSCLPLATFRFKSSQAAHQGARHEFCRRDFLRLLGKLSTNALSLKPTVKQPYGLETAPSFAGSHVKFIGKRSALSCVLPK